MSGTELAVRCVGGAVAYLGVGLACAPLFLWIDRCEGQESHSDMERGGHVLGWPLWIVLATIFYGVPAGIGSIGRLSAWLSPYPPRPPMEGTGEASPIKSVRLIAWECPDCDGRGLVPVPEEDDPYLEMQCSRCKGTGRIEAASASRENR